MRPGISFGSAEARRIRGASRRRRGLGGGDRGGPGAEPTLGPQESERSRKRTAAASRNGQGLWSCSVLFSILFFLVGGEEVGTPHVLFFGVFFQEKHSPFPAWSWCVFVVLQLVSFSRDFQMLCSEREAQRDTHRLQDVRPRRLTPNHKPINCGWLKYPRASHRRKSKRGAMSESITFGMYSHSVGF